MVEGELVHGHDSIHGGKIRQDIRHPRWSHASLVVGDRVDDVSDLGWGVDRIVMVPLVDIEGIFGVRGGGITNTVA